MKKYFFIFIFFLLVSSVFANPVANLWVETARTTYEINEIVLLQASISDPIGLQGNICILGKGEKIQECKILPWFVLGQTGAQVEFRLMETLPGRYTYKVYFISKGNKVVSNTIEITFNSVFDLLPPIGTTKNEAIVIDGYQYRWYRELVVDKNGDGIPDWDIPMPVGTPYRVQLAPAKSGAISWGSLKKVK